MTVLSALLVSIGGAMGGQSGAILFFIISIGMNLFSYFFSSKLAIKAARAKEINISQYPEIFEDTKVLSETMGIPMPKLFISPQKQPNAFATGRGPRDGVVCLTAGIMEVLNREELRGVIAHELAHIKNRDILISTIAAVMASAISMGARMSMFGGSNDDDSAGSMAGGLIAVLLGPIAALIIQMAISRSREFSADEVAARAIGSGRGLASALETITSVGKTVKMDTKSQAFASLYISNPFGGVKGLSNLFSTHPPMRERVSRLQNLDL